MLKDNESIALTGCEEIKVLSEIECILISLRNIARHYYHCDNNITEEIEMEYYKETTRFVDENNVTYRLADIRKVISEKFNDALGDDDMDDIEREMEKIKCWEKPGD